MLIRQFQTACMSLKRKQYDMLAPRTTEFQTDFVQFMGQISQIEVWIIFLCLQSSLYIATVVSLSCMCSILLPMLMVIIKC